MFELARAAREILYEAERSWIVRRTPWRHCVLAPVVREGPIYGPRGNPSGCFRYFGRLPGWCLVWTRSTRYARRRYVLTPERVRQMSDAELEAVLLAQSL